MLGCQVSGFKLLDVLGFFLARVRLCSWRRGPENQTAEVAGVIDIVSLGPGVPQGLSNYFPPLIPI